MVARVLGAAILLAAWVVPCRAQTQGGIGGLVTDASGAPLSGADVTATNKATRGTRKAMTNAQGLYAVPSLPPGVYALRVELRGLKIAEMSDVKIDVQQTARLDVALEVGTVEETVTVSGEAPLLNTGSTTIGTVVENKVVTELPLNGRQYLNLVAQAPNVNVLSPAAGQAGARLGGERAQQAISAGGQRIFFNYFTLDGVNNTDPNFQNYIALPSIDAIQEFKVQTGVYPAEFGHQSTQVNVVTKSGGNRYHGSMFEFVRDEKFDAKPYAFTSVHPAKSPFKWNDYGFE
ncbi:MAG: carboxypeptidase regulatory-like domain-containing protein, partial [bacterium]